MPVALSLSAEIRRKTIHLVTSVIPLLYFFYLNREQILVICIILTIGFLTADLLRMVSSLANSYFMRVFSSLLRSSEKEKQLTGATILFAALTLSVLVFPVPIAVTAMLLLTLADPVAAIVGKYWGKKSVFNKTLEGTLGFFMTALFIVLLVNGIKWQALPVAAIAAIVELIPLPVNDNLSVPLISGLAMFAFY